MNTEESNSSNSTIGDRLCKDLTDLRKAFLIFVPHSYKLKRYYTLGTIDLLKFDQDTLDETVDYMLTILEDGYDFTTPDIKLYITCVNMFDCLIQLPKFNFDWFINLMIKILIFTIDHDTLLYLHKMITSFPYLDKIPIFKIGWIYDLYRTDKAFIISLLLHICFNYIFLNHTRDICIICKAKNKDLTRCDTCNLIQHCNDDYCKNSEFISTRHKSICLFHNEFFMINMSRKYYIRSLLERDPKSIVPYLNPKYLRQYGMEQEEKDIIFELIYYYYNI